MVTTSPARTDRRRDEVVVAIDQDVRDELHIAGVQRIDFRPQPDVDTSARSRATTEMVRSMLV
jgi:hypothetical protein